MKIFVGFMLSLIVIGITIGVAVVAFAGFNMDNLQLMDESDFEKVHYVAEGRSFSKIQTDLRINNIKIERTEIEAFEVFYPQVTNEMHEDKTKIEVSEIDGVLSIKDNVRKDWLNFFGNNLFFSEWRLSEETLCVTIIIPQDFNGDLTLKTVNGVIRGENLGNIGDLIVKSTNGNIIFDGFKASSFFSETTNSLINIKNAETALDIKAYTTNGIIEISDSICEEVSAKTTNGDIKIKRIAAGVVDIKTTNGEILADDIKATTIKSKNTNGKISFKYTEVSDISVSTTNGYITISVLGLKSDYAIDLKTTNGKVAIDGDKFGKKINLGNGPKSINASNTNGNIEVSFI